MEISNAIVILRAIINSNAIGFDNLWSIERTDEFYFQVFLHVRNNLLPDSY